MYDIRGQNQEQAVQTKQTQTTYPMSEIAEKGAIAVDTHRMSKKAAPRFELLVAAAGVDGLSELGAVPEAVTRSILMRAICRVEFTCTDYRRAARLWGGNSRW